MPKVSGMIVIPASLRSDFIHIAGMPIHIPLESTIHIAGISSQPCACSDAYPMNPEDEQFALARSVQRDRIRGPSKSMLEEGFREHSS
jgi:hypothetical protein